MRKQPITSFLACLLALAGGAMAQNVSSSLIGTVNDPSGAPVMGAEAQLVSQTTGGVFTAKSNSLGLFRFPILQPDRYNLSVQSAGFKTYVQNEIEVTASETRDLGRIALEMGSVRENITVEAVATPVQTASSEKSALVTGEQLNQIALKGRDFLGLMYTLPGIVDTRNNRDSTSPNNIGGLYIAGGRQESKNFTVDGINDLDTGSNDTIHYEPNMDAIAEVRVLTSNYQAEFGRSSGGAITVITKGGGREFHGGGWFTYRDKGLNSNTWANNKSGIAKSPYHLTIEGFTIGGPFFIPKHFNTDRKRLFFFFSQEYTGNKSSGTDYGYMPTAAERAGDFSRSVDTDGSPIIVTDPTTGNPFPRNVIPSSRLNATGAAVLNFFPQPNFSTSDPAYMYARNYAAPSYTTHSRRNDVLRGDWYITDRLNAYVRYINDHDDTFGNDTYSSYPALAVDHPNPGHGYAGHLVYTINPTLVNETTLGKSFNTWDYFAVDDKQWDRGLMGNIPKWYPIDTTLGNQKNYVPDIIFGGTPAGNVPSVTSDQLPYWNGNNIYSASDNLSKVWGPHNFKFGVYFERTQKIENQELGNYLGAYDFSTDGNNPNDTGDTFANALLGNFDSYTETSSRLIQRIWFTDLEFYAQDNWRVNRRLTLDIGLRLYHVTPQADQHNALAGFNPTLFSRSQIPALYQPALVNGDQVARDPITGKTYPYAYVGMIVPGSGNPANGAIIGGLNGVPPGVYSVSPLSYGPRLGFSYDVFGTGKTAIRGGIGMFHDTIDGNPSMNMSGNPPLSYTPVAYYGNLSTMQQSGGLIGPSDIYFLLGKQQMPRTVSYSLGVQQSLGFGTVLDVSYVGNFARHLLWIHNINEIPIGARFDPANQDPAEKKGTPLPDNFLRPYLGWGNLYYNEFAATSNYNSLQVALNRRFSHGLMFAGSYTFSKTLGEANAETSSVSSYFDPRHRNYGPLSYDRRHVMTFSYGYDLPKLKASSMAAKAAGAVLNNWTLSGIVTYSTGSPVLPTFSYTPTTDVTGSSEGARINVLCNPNDMSGRTWSIYNTYNTSCFGPAPVGSFGNAGVGIMQNPAYVNWDTSLGKKIPVGLGEKRVLSVRFESYNTFNHTEFNAIGTSFRFRLTNGAQTSTTVGQYTGTRAARIMSLAIRFTF
ncbi:MAG TPA: carboxypeptidase regulatory-like domain-containing protein [Bryobacteraceae bacterium]|nr:carboxypeptidase regulatory-like domain-containing protein [Bryobacteraceae bacterium]